jgi:hypothetical protein
MRPDVKVVRLQWRMRVALSLIFVGACFYIILSGGYPEGVRTWAAGLIGVVGGYWLR